VGKSLLSGLEGRRGGLENSDGEMTEEDRPSECCASSSDASAASEGAREARAMAVPNQVRAIFQRSHR